MSKENGEIEKPKTDKEKGNFSLNINISSRLKKILAVIAVVVLLAFGGFYFYRNRANSDIDPVVAVVNGEKLFLSDLSKAYENAKFIQGEGFSKEEMLDIMIDQTLLLQTIKRLGITASIEDVWDYFKKTLEEKGIPEKNFYSLSEKKGLSKLDIFQLFQKRLLMEKFYEQRINPRINISEEDLIGYYAKNRDMFMLPEAVNASHILVDTEKEANEIRIQLESGVSIEVLANKSIDSAAGQNKGHLGFITRGRTVPEFEQAAFSLEEGEVSEPVQTKFGYHIIQVSKKSSSRQLSYGEAKDVISQILFAKRQTELLDIYMDMLKGKSSIERYEKFFQE